jgi:hypothetical protein
VQVKLLVQRFQTAGHLKREPRHNPKCHLGAGKNRTQAVKRLDDLTIHRFTDSTVQLFNDSPLQRFNPADSVR